jgi:hypothetical protein
MTPRPERRSPLRELFSFLGSALAGLRVLGRRPEPLPEVPATNGAPPRRPRLTLQTEPRRREETEEVPEWLS